MNREKEASTVGIVTTEYCDLAVASEGFTLERGGVLRHVRVAFERYGTLSEKGDNVILICHALTGDAHAAGRHKEDDRKAGWWETMIGPGKGIDTNRFHVICTNILGGCMGTTGPASINPETGKPYGLDFPEITIGDMVAVQKCLLDQLGITHLWGVVGGSAGGVQTLEWVSRFPHFVDRAICLAAAESLSAQALSFDIVARKIIMNDPNWNGGDYYGTSNEHTGLSLARMIAHITYLSQESMEEKFGRERREDMESSFFSTDFQVESYLTYQGESFVNRFDANSYLYITKAMNNFSLAEKTGSLQDAFKESSARLFFIALSSDWLYPSEQSKKLASALMCAGKQVSYFEHQSPYGHDSFLLESDELSAVIGSFLTGKADVSDVVAPLEERPDLIYMSKMLTPSSRVLDLGCGDGSFLHYLSRTKGCLCHGIDIDVASIVSCNQHATPVFQADVTDGLEMIPDKSYDFAIMSGTLQELNRPDVVIDELLRISKNLLISFPNFAHWKHRVRLGLNGRLPMNGDLPFEWYNSPNNHFVTLLEFKQFCQARSITIQQIEYLNTDKISAGLVALGFENAGAASVVMRLTRE
jgi:homoserine O-acetyltransferase